MLLIKKCDNEENLRHLKDLYSFWGELPPSMWSIMSFGVEGRVLWSRIVRWWGFYSLF